MVHELYVICMVLVCAVCMDVYMCEVCIVYMAMCSMYGPEENLFPQHTSPSQSEVPAGSRSLRTPGEHWCESAV